VWAVTGKNRNMPVDAEPATGDRHANGLLTLTVDDLGVPLALPATSFERVGDEPLYTSHFATCPNASDHRRPRG
jgi:hypothetical protein